MKSTRFAVVCLLMTLASVVLLSVSSFGQRISPPGIVLDGTNAGICGDPSPNGGIDGCLYRLGVGVYGWTNGIAPSPQSIPLVGNILLNAPAAAGTLGTATTGGTIPAGTYRLSLIYYTLTGGRTPGGADSGSTQVTTGSASTITGNAPSAVSGAVGYGIGVSPASGAANTEVLQPVTTANCAGAFTVGGGSTICPFGANYTLFSVTAAGDATPFISSAPNTAGLVQLTAGAQAAITTVTTAQAAGSWTLPAGAMNVQGKRMHIHGMLQFSNGVTTPAITVSVKIGSSVTPLSIVGASNANSNTNSPLHFDGWVQTTTIGASGADEAHGCMSETVAAAWSSGTAMATYCDGNVAASSTYDHTVANTLAINVAASAALTSVTLRDLQVDFTQF